MVLRSNDANGTGRTKVLEPIAELVETPSDDSMKSTEVVLEEIPLMRDDCGVSKDDEVSAQDVANGEEASFISRKGDTIDTSDFRSKSLSCSALSGMRRVIGSLPVLPRSEKQQPSTRDEKIASESTSETGYTSPNVFAKCSKRCDPQQNAPTWNIPELIIS